MPKVSNQGRGVVDKGDSGNATATAPDVDKVPAAIPVPFPNFAPSSTIGANQTSTTFIAGQPIAVMGTHIGPQSNPGHPGVNKGVASSTYRQHAEPVTVSSDLIIENRGAFRMLDMTLQNNANTTGIMLTGMFAFDASNIEKKAKDKCTIVKLEGNATGGRKLGWQDKRAWHRGQQTGEPRYLEILTDDVVLFHTTRKDVTKKPHKEDPDCGKPHTEWTITHTTYPLRRTTVEQKKGTEFAFVVGADAIDKDVRFVADVAKNLRLKIQEDGVKEWARQFEWPQKAGEKLLGPVGGLLDKLDTKPQTLASSSAEDHRWGGGIGGHYGEHEVYKKTKTDRDIGLQPLKNLWEFFKLMTWSLMPPVIDVKAIGCAGTQTATLLVYPHTPFKFGFSATTTTKTSRSVATQGEKGSSGSSKDKQVAAILETLKKAKLAAWICEKFFRLGGSELKTVIARGFSVDAEAQFKHNTKLDKNIIGELSTPASVGLNWKITLKASVLLGASGEIAFSLFKFIPYIGLLAEKLLKKLGIRCELYFECSISSSLEGSFGRDEYGHLNAMTSATITITIKPFAGARVGYFPKGKRFSSKDKKDAEAAGLVARFGFPITAKLTLRITEERGKLIVAEPWFQIKTGFEMTVKVWRFFRWEAVPYTEPPDWRITLPRRGQKKPQWVVVAGPT